MDGQVRVGCSVLIVEDEPLIAMMVEDMLQEMGCAHVGVAQSPSEALTSLASSTPGIALLDLKLGLETSLGIAAFCRARNIPVVFVTGYAAQDVPADCGDDPVVCKPFGMDDLKRAIGRAKRFTNSLTAAPEPSPADISQQVS